MNKDTRRMLRVPEELHSKIEIFKKENNISTSNKAIINLIELGLIRNNEDRYFENYFIRIIKQLNYLTEMVEEFIDEYKS